MAGFLGTNTHLSPGLCSIAQQIIYCVQNAALDWWKTAPTIFNSACSICILSISQAKKPSKILCCKVFSQSSCFLPVSVYKTHSYQLRCPITKLTEDVITKQNFVFHIFTCWEISTLWLVLRVSPCQPASWTLSNTGIEILQPSEK